MADAESIRQQAAPVAEEVLHFPDSDGRFLPENPRQAAAIVSLRCDLEAHFDGVRDVTVRGNMFIYYDRLDLRKSVAPDVFVVLGHDLGGRTTYNLWQEGKPPDFAMEVVSPSSQVRNRTEKKALYAQLGFREYFLFQPDPAEAPPRLVGYQLWGREYLEVPGEVGPGGTLEIPSDQLGVSLRVEGERLRMRNLKTGRDYPWHTEWPAKLSAAEEGRREAEEARRAAEEARRAAEQQSQRHAVARRAAEQASKEAERRIAALRAELRSITRKGTLES